MKSLSSTQASYIAGFLDGDGSIYVRLKPNQTYRYGFQIAPNIVFYQSQKEVHFLHVLQEVVGAGYIRLRKDGIAEYTIGDTATMRELVAYIEPYLIFKKAQANLLIQILDQKEYVQSKDDFLQLAKLIDRFKELNYSKKRTIGAAQVMSSKKFVTP